MSHTKRETLLGELYVNGTHVGAAHATMVTHYGGTGYTCSKCGAACSEFDYKAGDGMCPACYEKVTTG
jgi:DNA-directed RNA polymerase subunit RPC12/RpoP